MDSLTRLADLDPRVLLPAHGPALLEPGAAFERALTRATRLVDDLDWALWYGARRVFGYALMIRGGIPEPEVEPYLRQRAWLRDAAGLLGRTTQEFASDLVRDMTDRGAVDLRDGRLHAAAEHTEVDPVTLQQPFPRDWPAPRPMKEMP